MHITRRTHGVLDYLVALVLIFSPLLLGMERGSVEARVPVMLGWATLAYSLLTRYELGVFKVLPFGAHLALDGLSGIVLAISPWLFQFSDRIWVPHLVLGLAELGVVAMTRATTGAAPGAPMAH